jgi:hypothetical protein
MEFRLNQSVTRPSSSEGGFSSPRIIRFASGIPALGLRGFDRQPRSIRLRAVCDVDAEGFVAVHGAEREGPFWTVRRKDPFPFDLGDHLPFAARRSIVPEVPAYARPRDWRRSLSGFLSARSLDRLSADVWRLERICHACGGVPFRPARLEAWDEWIVTRSGGVRLVAVRMLCPACLETRCLASAEARGRLEPALARLMAINRIEADEREDYVEAMHAASCACLPEVADVDLSWLGEAAVELDPDVAWFGTDVLRRRGCAGAMRVVGLSRP